MHIPKELPQFEDGSALLIVSGSKSCTFYFAKDGELTEEESFRIEAPTYSDREGFFIKLRGAQEYVSGSVYEAKKFDRRKKFLSEMDGVAKKIIEKRGPTAIYLFAPAYRAPNIESALPTETRKRIRKTIRGNYSKTHPLKILEKLSPKKSGGFVSPIKEEAKKILDKGRRFGK